MFTFMREQLQQEDETKLLVSSVLEGVGDNVKDIFLNDSDLAPLRADNDPQIERLVASIPEYKPTSESAISQLTESLLVEV